LTDDGKLRSSVSTNVDVGADFSGMEPSAVRRAVRGQAEAFTKGTLRVALSDATADASAARAAAVEARDTAKAVTLGAIALSVLVALAAAVWLYRTIAGRFGRAQESARRVAAGDLDTTFEVHGNDEIGSLVEAIEEMRASVVGQLAVMREMAGAVIVTPGMWPKVRAASARWLSVTASPSLRRLSVWRVIRSCSLHSRVRCSRSKEVGAAGTG